MRTTVLVLAALLPLATGCATDDTEVAEVTVLDHLAPCVGLQVLDCMLVDEGRGPQFFDDRITGFEYHWGSTYRLEVDIVQIRHPPPDGSSRELRLRRTIDVQPIAAGSEFTLRLRGEPGVEGRQMLTPSGQGFAMPRGRQIACDDPATCTAITDALGRSAAFDLRLRHPADPADESLPLTALAVSSP